MLAKKAAEAGAQEEALERDIAAIIVATEATEAGGASHFQRMGICSPLLQKSMLLRTMVLLRTRSTSTSPAAP